MCECVCFFENKSAFFNVSFNKYFSWLIHQYIKQSPFCFFFFFFFYFVVVAFVSLNSILFISFSMNRMHLWKYIIFFYLIRMHSCFLVYSIFFVWIGEKTRIEWERENERNLVLCSSLVVLLFMVLFNGVLELIKRRKNN